MKNALLALAGFAGLALAAPAAAEDPPSYTLFCRGGPSMDVSVSHDVGSDGALGRTHFRLYFDRAAQRGGGSPPGPGQCAWIDRPLNNAEPTTLWMAHDGVELTFGVRGDGAIAADANGPRMYAEGLEPAAGDLSFLMRQVLTGQLFTVQAYNAEGRVLVITRVNR